MVVKTQSDKSSMKKNKTSKNKGGLKLKGSVKQKRKKTDNEEVCDCFCVFNLYYECVQE